MLRGRRESLGERGMKEGPRDGKQIEMTAIGENGRVNIEFCEKRK